MKVVNWIGWGLLVSPAIALLIVLGIHEGLEAALFVFGAGVALISVVTAGAYLAGRE